MREGPEMKDETQIQEILERLARVEQQNRRFKQGGILLVVLACCLLISAQGVQKPRIVEAEQFLLRDAAGHVVGLWGSSAPPTQPGPVLVMFTEKGDAGAQLSVGQSGTALRIKDPNGYEAVFGTESLIDPTSGQKTATSVASLIFYGRDKAVIWRAPGS
jgi:hypothetical protein